MASTPASSPGSVVIDANVLIAICAREKDKFDKAQDALNDYARSGWLFYGPGVVIGEVLYVLLSLWRRFTPRFPSITNTNRNCKRKSRSVGVKSMNLPRRNPNLP